MDCGEKIISEDYGDFIYEIDNGYEDFLDRFSENCPELVGINYGIIHKELSDVQNIDFLKYQYYQIPKLYALMDINAATESGATKLQNYLGNELKGRNVIIGFIDDGIDVYHKAFRYSNGNTRIISIWEQGVNDENRHELKVNYGRVIGYDTINEELKKENSEMLRSISNNSEHGTFMAGIAAGNSDIDKGFMSIAPYADIAMVKLKPAKRYLKNYYFADENSKVYQENDIVTGVNYLTRLAVREKKDLIICITLGTSFGAHDGSGVLNELLDAISNIGGIGVCVATGNEGNTRHHFVGNVPKGGSLDVELSVEKDKNGLVCEIWIEPPDLFSVLVISPTGESISRKIMGISGNERYEFLFDRTIVEISYEAVEKKSGNELIRISFTKPTEGVWVIRVLGDIVVNGIFNVWMPINEIVGENTFFLKSDPNTTLTIPSDSTIPISVGAYDTANGGIFLKTGRGFTENFMIKPDLVAPGVNILGPVYSIPEYIESENRYESYGFAYKTGTSISAAIIAGIMAQFMEWGNIRGNINGLTTTEIKSYLIRGTKRKNTIVYPSTDWGYGEVDAYNSINILR